MPAGERVDAATSSRKKRGMACPACGAPTSIPESRSTEDQAAVRRVRRCPNGHTFRTIESLERPPLTLYAIRRSSDRNLSKGTFAPAKFREQLTLILFGNKGPFEEKTLDAISDRAQRRLQAELPQADTRLTESEYRARGDIIGALPDTMLSA